MVENKSFEIKNRWASPQLTTKQQISNIVLFPNGSSTGNIDISNIINYLKIKNDSVMAYLPFYGERRFGGAYNNTAGIEFEGIPNDFQINKGKKGSYEIRFSIDDKNTNTENYRVYIKLLPDMSSTININSSGRSSIQYRGNINIAGGD